MGNSETSATQFFERGRTGKLWEIILKAMVPISIIIGGAMIRNEIVDNEQTLRIHRLETDVTQAAPLSIQGDVRSLVGGVQLIQERLARIETKIEALEKE